MSKHRTISNRLRSSLVVIAALLATLVGGTQVSAAASAQASSNTLDLKVLLVSADGNEPALKAWQSRLIDEGVPFDLITTVTAPPISADQLEIAPGHARYQAVVLASPDLAWFNGTEWTSSVSPDELETIQDFERSYGIRQVDAYAYPNPSLGLNEPSYSGELDGMTASLTPSGSAVFTYLVGPISIEDSYGYLATPNPAEGSTFDPLVNSPTGEALVGVYSSDGREEMVVTVDSSPNTHQSHLWLHGMLQWVTRGTYLGMARNYLSVHVDDVFLPDDRWDSVSNVTHEDGGSTLPLIRMNEADGLNLKNWQEANDLKLDLAFNGNGSVEHIRDFGSDPLTNVLLGNRKSFRWINHTFGHLNLDQVSQSTIESEITRNRWWAWIHRIQIESSELVTGEHSGLDNPSLPSALERVGIHSLASDASRSPNQTRIGPALTVPRHPMNVYYNVATRDEQLDEYNYLYFENCTPTPQTTCLSAPVTWDQYLDQETSMMMHHMMANDPRPHYAHQANLAEDRILFSVLDLVLSRYRSHFNVPLVQPTMTEVRRELARRSAWNSAIQSGKISGSVTNGVVELKSSVDIAVPVTTTPNARLGFFSFASKYGQERSGWLNLRSSRTYKIRNID